LLVTSFSTSSLVVAVSDEVTMLADTESDPISTATAEVQPQYPYHQWAMEDQEIFRKHFPSPPAEPKSANADNEIVRWAMMRGLKQDLVDAKEARSKHQIKTQEDEREKREAAYIAAEITKNRVEKLAKAGTKAGDNEMADAEAEHDVAAEDTAQDEAAEGAAKGESTVLLQESPGKASQQRREKAIVAKAAHGEHLPATSEVCRIAQKGLTNICKSYGTGSDKCAGGQKIYSQKCRHPDDSLDALSLTSVHVKEGSSLHYAASVTKSFTPPADGTTVHVKEGSSLHNEATATAHVKEGTSLHNEATATAHVKEGTSLQFAVGGMADSSNGTTSHAKEGTSLHKASGSPKSAAAGSPAQDKAKYFGKKDQVLHRNDASFDGHKVPAALKKAAKAEISQVASAAAKDSKGLESYKKSIVDVAVEAASPKVAELKHKASIKAKIAAQSEEARANNAVKEAKQKEEKEQEKEDQAAEAVKTNEAVSKAEDKAVKAIEDANHEDQASEEASLPMP
jgi:hypothetical protein